MFIFVFILCLFLDESSVNKNNSESQEIALNKASGKTFPSLVVTARPNLKTKFMNQTKIAQERTALG